MASHPVEVGDTPSPRWYLPTLGWSLVAGGVLPSGVVAAPPPSRRALRLSSALLVARRWAEAVECPGLSFWRDVEAGASRRRSGGLGGVAPARAPG